MNALAPSQTTALMGGLLDVLCPMHLVLNKVGMVVHAGPTARKVLGEDGLTGQRFFELFEVRRPKITPNMAGLRDARGKKMQCVLRSPDRTEFKGVVVPLPMQGVQEAAAGGAIVDLSFGIGVIEAVGRHDLTNSDFAVTDLTVEMLYLIEAKSVVTEAWQKLNQRLQGAKARAEEEAHTDTLTGLFNRRALDTILQRLITVGDEFALMQLDLDFFKDVNDTLGHSAGDAVLRRVAEILRCETRAEDTIIRVGGDEFVLIFPHPMQPKVLAQLARRLIARLEQPIKVDGGEARISGSIGIATSDLYETPNMDQMMADADLALYAAKERGRGRHVIFSPKLRRKDRRAHPKDDPVPGE